ncbi:MAG: CoB--CoM heterodisulfide reductase iron-sulfur subunit B family protein [Candidatus Aminicenantes bacterium]|jgi:heterodisulfide reductase subunit B
MKLSYYPGCTLKNHAKNFEDSTLCSLKQLGIDVDEIPRWNCCGTVFSLSTDDLMHHLAPIRNLIRVKETSSDSVMTLCSMCYHTLKAANARMKSHPEDLDTINEFMYREELKYEADVKVLHLLEILRDEVKFENLTQKVEKPLKKLKIANYYGCLLVRPKELGLDDMENPTVMESLMTALGATTIDFPYKTECCASYQTVDKPEIVADRAYDIITSARNMDAEVLAVSCPLCAFNLDHRQKKTQEKYPEFKTMPVLYFTQLMAIALGCDEKDLRLDLHYVDPKPLLKQKKLL